MEIYLSKNNNLRSTAFGKYYAYRDPKKNYSIDDMAAHMSEHNTPFSTGTIKGILEDFVSCIRELVLEGYAVKIDNLAIFKASIQNKGGWATLDAVDLNIGGANDNIHAIRLCAQATGRFTKAELSSQAVLKLTRDWKAKVHEAKEVKRNAQQQVENP